MESDSRRRAVGPVFLPYEADYVLLGKWRTVGTACFLSVFVLSLVSSIAAPYYQSNALLAGIVEFATLVAIVTYFTVDMVSEVFLAPAAARSRRMGFIDNSFGSKFLSKPTENYFSNDALERGLYKMAVNCFENCYFSYNIAKAMTASLVTKNVIISVVFAVIAYTGLRGNQIVIPFLQLLLSTLFIAELIHHFAFRSRLKALLERFEDFFSYTAQDPAKRNVPQYPIRFLLEYETALAYNKSPLSSKLYKQLNEKLSAEWEEIKERLAITAEPAA